tara:strand:- start:842 stop:1846 length:1005 start_codon:yes stop_codon:yes gene_type:complete
MALLSKDFEKAILIPFLKQHGGADVFKEENYHILKKYCDIHGLDYLEVIKPDSELNTKLKDRFRQIKKRKCDKKSDTKKSHTKKSHTKKVLPKKVPKLIEEGQGKCRNALKKVNKIVIENENKVNELTTKKDADIREVKHFGYGKHLESYDSLSENLLNTLSFASKLQIYLDNYTCDYNYFLNGGADATEKYNYISKNGDVSQRIRDRNKFASIEVKEEIDKINIELVNATNPYRQQILGEQFDRLNKLYRFYKNFEKEELYVYTSAAETHFNLQKAVNGSILNEAAMVENKIINSQIEQSPDIPPALQDLYKSEEEGKENKVFKIINERNNEQ